MKVGEVMCDAPEAWATKRKGRWYTMKAEGESTAGSTVNIACWGVPPPAIGAAMRERHGYIEREDWKKRKRSSHQNPDTRQAPWTATLS
jgi:hypothetical protein